MLAGADVASCRVGLQDIKTTKYKSVGGAIGSRRKSVLGH